MTTRFSELSESDFRHHFTCLLEQKIVVKQRRQLELVLIYFGNMTKERNSEKSLCNSEKQVSELLGVKLLL